MLIGPHTRTSLKHAKTFATRFRTCARSETNFLPLFFAEWRSKHTESTQKTLRRASTNYTLYKRRQSATNYIISPLILSLRQKQRLAYRLSLHHAAPLTTHASCLDTDTRDLDILKGGGGFRAQRVMDPPPPCAAQAAFCESLSQTFCINLHANAFDAVFCSAEC